MNGALQRFARRWWAGEAGLLGSTLSVVLRPLSWCWLAVTWFRNRRFDRGFTTQVDGLSVVSIGNLAVGGTGKTPIASWVTGVLLETGAAPALLLGSSATDEALLHERWTPSAPVFVGRRRVASAVLARTRGAGVAVMDDGFQYRELARDCDIVLLAVEDPFPASVLPCGPHREARGALRRADAVILTRRSATLDRARQRADQLSRSSGVPADIAKACVHFVSAGFRPLAGDRQFSGLDDALVLTAIARPRGFLRDVAVLCRGSAELLAYRDHHPFSEHDARTARLRAGRRPIVVTEKDAVKLVPVKELLGEVWIMEQEVTWDWGEEVVRGLVTAVARRQSPT